ncbi:MULTISPECIES: TetR/AcrR family transcriptional regulator [Undibacterium]|jgi:AcrR family transcriptional regulator|uniref:TetR/AcrR family transcriptional regulator n=1 Tax=Undibacterium umbellatum TaxID=2762300 RepID=A0ABR6ZDK1_9BURK|nr:MULTISPECIES: TetR/AcrR family transcriptional regulator [Undibacterium]MBC3909421.1 TetR/AcrR family transcriptional regulator [Undibacterium umbellatum]MDP1979988.1 helix-turn-helix domain-containing protein [Undibacterium sp.]
MEIRIPFKKQQFDAREEAIIDAVNRLLSEKGYDLMTMDDVADAVGIAKGSLYKHFSSKEKLAGAAMTRLLKATQAELDTLAVDMPAIDKIRHILAWSLRLRLQGGVPHLPSTSLALQRSLMLNLDYVMVALRVNKRFYALVAQAREQGALTPLVPDDVLVYTLYSRACDPTMEFLMRDKRLTHEQIVDAMVHATIGGFLSNDARKT